MRGLKLEDCINIFGVVRSHPTWVRGLKPVSPYHSIPTFLSHPTWVRGLKLYGSLSSSLEGVASYVGAWIET